jgi:hypothetical protein
MERCGWPLSGDESRQDEVNKVPIPAGQLLPERPVSQTQIFAIEFYEAVVGDPALQARSGHRRICNNGASSRWNDRWNCYA